MMSVEKHCGVCVMHCCGSPEIKAIEIFLFFLALKYLLVIVTFSELHYYCQSVLKNDWFIKKHLFPFENGLLHDV